MKHLVKAQLYARTALFALSTAAFGATVTAVPAQLPKDAFANGGGGVDQQFFQTLLITLQNNGPDAWDDGDVSRGGLRQGRRRHGIRVPQYTLVPGRYGDRRHR